jgi:hypothetical protein
MTYKERLERIFGWGFRNTAGGTYADNAITEFNKALARWNTALFSVPGLAIGSGDKAKVKIVNTLVYRYAGVAKTKTAAEVAFTATTHDLVKNTQAYYVYTMIADGTVTVTMGTPVADGATPVIPTPPAGLVLGYVLIHAATAAIFDATTTELDALGGGGSIAYTDCLGYLNTDTLTAVGLLSARTGA